MGKWGTATDIKDNSFKIVDEKNVAWHAGISYWKGDSRLNKNSIGIELENKGHQFGYENFSTKQISSLIKLCKNLKEKYHIKKNTNT